MLAFVGDGVFELLVRGHLIEDTPVSIKNLHRKSVAQVNAAAQCDAYDNIENLLTPEEGDILRRGRNASVPRVPKSFSVEEYHKATAVEALFGYLYLKGEFSRVLELFQLVLSEYKKKGEREAVNEKH